MPLLGVGNLLWAGNLGDDLVVAAHDEVEVQPVAGLGIEADRRQGVGAARNGREQAALAGARGGGAGALDCYVTYQEVVEENQPLRNAERHGVCFQVFQASPRPRLEALTENLPGD